MRMTHCPRCKKELDRGQCYACPIGIFHGNNSEEVTAITLYEATFPIYIYFEEDFGGERTEIIMNGDDEDIKFKTAMTHLIYKTIPELNEWIKTILIFQ